MRLQFNFTTPLSIFICAFAGCSAAADAQDGVVGESANQGVLDNNSSSTTTTSAADDAETYYELTHDLRRCASPLCGGWFLKRLNRPTMMCLDGQQAARCYTPALDWSEANLSDAQRTKLLEASDKDAVSQGVYAVVSGQLVSGNATPRPEMGRFVISEAWLAEGDSESSGEYVRVKDNGVRCIAAPCPSLTETTLNTPRSVDIAAIDWAPSGLSEREIEAFQDELYTPDGIMIAGDRYTVRANGNTAKGRTATAAYHRLSNATP